MSDKFKGIVIGIIIGCLVSGGAVVANSGMSKIDVVFKALNFRVDGVEKKLTDTRPIVYKGTTYVPMRFIGESFGQPVNFDGKTNTVWIGKRTVVANYRGGFVTRQELDKNIDILDIFNDYEQDMRKDTKFQSDFLHQLIAHRLTAGKLDAKTMAEIKTLAASELQMAKTYVNESNPKEFQNQLDAFKLKEQDVLEYIERSFVLRKFFDQQVTAQQVRNKYNEDVKANKYRIASVRHILIANDSRSDAQALARANEVRGKLVGGGSFDALAKEYSDDPGSKNNGGLYADANVEEWVPEFKNAAVTLPLNTLSQPVKTNFGYHIMRVEKRRTLAFSEVEKEIRSNLAIDKMYNYLEVDIPKMITSKNLSLR